MILVCTDSDYEAWKDLLKLLYVVGKVQSLMNSRPKGSLNSRWGGYITNFEVDVHAVYPDYILFLTFFVLGSIETDIF
jgi:hypothetical protein